MNKNLFLTLLAAGSLFVASCKNDSEDDLKTTAPVENADYTGIMLNEICGASANGDWVELYNNSDKPVNLGNVTLSKTDETGTTDVVYTFDANSVIAAKGYLVVYGKDSKNPQITAGISNTKEVALELKSPTGTSIDKFDRDANVGKDKGHDTDGSYARIPNGDKNGQWKVEAQATEGTENKDVEAPSPTPSGDITGVALNEICGLSDEDDSDDWIELYNTTDKDITLDGAKILKDGKDEMYVFPAGTVIKAGAYLVLSTAKGELKKNISNKKEVAIDLETADGKSVNSFDRDKDLGADAKHDAGQSYSREPDGTGAWKVATATRGTKN